MQGKLIYCDSKGQLASLPLSGEPVRIGRGTSCQISVSDPAIAEEHCSVQPEGDIWVVEQLGSGQTFLNDQDAPIRKHPLRSRDIIRCGSLWVQYLLPEASAEWEGAAPASPVLEGLPASAQALVKAAAKELVEQKALTKFLQEDKDALIKELAQLKSAHAELGRRAEELETEQARRERMLNLQQQEVSDTQDATRRLQAQVEQLETDLTLQKRELELARTDGAQSRAKASAASQQIAELEAAVARLLDENKGHVNQVEHLRAILDQKDQVIEQVRTTPDATLTELAQLRLQHEDVTNRLKKAEAERDAVQVELARRARAQELLEEELRRLQHQQESLVKLTASQNEGGSNLVSAIDENSTLKKDLAALRQRLTSLNEQLSAVIGGLNPALTELGAKLYSLRAAVSRIEQGPGDATTMSAIHDAFDQLLEHLNEGNGQVRSLRKAIEQSSAVTPTEPLKAAS